VTKGAFFHHFENKEALGVAAAQYWSAVTSHFFAHANYHQPKDPLERLLGYIDFRRELISGEIPEFTCLVGTMVQEQYDSNPAIREACQESIFGHAATLVKDITEAKKLYAPQGRWQPDSLALHTQAVLQGAFILAKAKGDMQVALDSVDHLRRYVELLFQRPQ
jgi:TetR/AcrR family transcriptional repressor of nem operon